MQLNLPILEHLAESENILIAGAGGGFDVFAGLPIYFTLRERGKNVHLANYSFTDLGVAQLLGETETLIAGQLIGARGNVRRPAPYYPEGFLAQWFREVRGENVTVWMFDKTGAAPLAAAYAQLIEHLQIDALILTDGGVDSIMRGDEQAPGTLLEDSITLAAVSELTLPVKLLACLGFGTEVEEMVGHHHALENIAALAKAGAYRGACALTPQMPVFQQFEAAARYVWEQPGHHKSHITTRVIPAVHGEFGDHHMYDYTSEVFISPLMSLYWFFDAAGVIERSLLAGPLRHTNSVREALRTYHHVVKHIDVRPRRAIPYF